MTEGIHYAKEIEKAILGLCLMELTGFGRTYNLINAESFYISDHVKVYETMREMYDFNLPIDMLSVWQKMESKNIKLNDGSISYFLTKLTNTVVSTTHLEYHCSLIKDMWRKRELEKLTHDGFNTNGNLKEELYRMYETLNNIRGNEYRQDWYDMNDLMYGLIQHQTDIRDGNKKFITTGIQSIDKENGGFSAGQLIVIGARPSVGKSAFMGQMAMAMAKAGSVVGIISMEMNNTEIAARLASIETNIDFSNIYRNLFEDQRQHDNFIDTISNQTSKLSIHVSDKTKVDTNEIKSKLSKLINTKGCHCLIVDYLQLVDSTSGNKNYNREQEVSKISRGLKLMAMEFQIPVIVLCQLNRGVTTRKGKERYPMLYDLRESGAIEQDADVVMMLHRDYISGFEADENGETTFNQADLLGLKWRNGSQFHIKLDFDPPKMKFSEKKITSWRPVPKIPVHDYQEDNPF